MNDYEERKAARIDRLKELAEKRRAEAEALDQRGRKMSEVIPLGQPILVGHHSERADRRYRGRIRSTFEKAAEAQNAADDAERRAEAAENNRAISSDDPEAVEKLKERLAKLEKKQAGMVAANKAIREGRDDKLKALGFSDERIYKLKKGDFAGRIGFASWELQNNNGNMRRIRERIKLLEKQQGRPSTEQQVGAVRIVDNAEANRLQLFFLGKPSEAIRHELKRDGFRWSPTVGAWQRYRGANATYYAEQIAKRFQEEGSQ